MPDSTDVDRKIDGAKAMYEHYPLARLKALLPTRNNSPTSFQYSALVELISEKEQALAHEVARKSRVLAMIALVLSGVAITVSLLKLGMEWESRSFRSATTQSYPSPRQSSPPTTTQSQPNSSSPSASASPLESSAQASAAGQR